MKSIKTSFLFASVLLTAGVSFAANGPPASQMVPVNKNQYDVDNAVPEGDPTDVFHNKSATVHNRQVFRVPAKGYQLAVKENGDVVTRQEVINQKMYIVEPQTTNAPYKYKEPK